MTCRMLLIVVLLIAIVFKGYTLGRRSLNLLIWVGCSPYLESCQEPLAPPSVAA
ncbi:hypothetical protein Sinac_4236 [Singulisphaera acidiphila DSM 18658]|uniref:Uncharacterized protein n=1 Tax=Singulisphaera acidiphila (strain ATCC BAA-1392 / DSM 18658 / VKM B-2454 / MOB10) TaxID=886293 RepID=L0DI04_SINAD|nr:hypothetical protein Sinac_4236 [Singulisphaera acidiphila DSM 18658]